MEEYIKQALFAFAVCLLFALGWLGGSRWPLLSRVRALETKVDTLIVRDTLRVSTPVICERRVTDTIRLTFRDTIEVALPREVVVYEDSTYRAEVSGYEPRLDKLDIYRRTEYITRTETLTEIVKKKGWGFSAFAGPAIGVGITPQGWQPYAGAAVGVGVTYNF